MQNGVHLVHVYPSFQWTVGTFKCKENAFFPTIRSEHLCEVGDILVQVTQGYIDDRGVSFLFLEVDEFVGQFCQTICAADSILKVFFSLFGKLLRTADFTERTLDESQWRADVMCRIGEELNFLM